MNFMFYLNSIDLRNLQDSFAHDVLALLDSENSSVFDIREIMEAKLENLGDEQRKRFWLDFYEYCIKYTP